MALLVAGYLLFLSGLGVALSVIRWLRPRAPRWGLMDHPGGRKDHPAPIPLIGGLAIMAAVTCPSVAGLLLARCGMLGAGFVPSVWAVHGPGIVRRAPELLAILAGSAVMMGLGYLDDRRGLSPWLRLGVQMGAAGLLQGVGVRATALLPEPWMHAVLTMAFITFLTNAVNFIDNMNGLSVGTVTVGASALLASAASTKQWFLAAILACLLGGCVAFLPQNFPRARIFLGDAGSMALGFLLGGLTLAFTFDDGAAPAHAILLPVLLLFVPLADGLTVIATRWRRGVHPFTAGHDHLSHRLVRCGLDRRQAVWVLWAVQGVAAIVAVIVARTPPSYVVVVAATVLGSLLLVSAGVRR